jgi:pyrimidine and pyridine-specific 5'-nucleotidase
MSIQGLKREHDRQITHYRNLLVRAQSASASSIHEMHMKLQDLQERYDTLRAEHAACGIAPSLPIRGQEGLGLIVGMRRMDKAGRMDILVAVLEGQKSLCS